MNVMKEALQVQDACNPRGVLRGWMRVLEAIEAENPYGDTEFFMHHPAMVLFASKMASLCDADYGFSAAYQKAKAANVQN